MDNLQPLGIGFIMIVVGLKLYLNYSKKLKSLNKPPINLLVYSCMIMIGGLSFLLLFIFF
jgi:hypothetical protein